MLVSSTYSGPKSKLLTTMEIDHDLQSGTLRPVERLAQLVVCTLHVWVAVARQNTPVADWDSHVVQTSSSHLVEIVLCEPRVPMLLQP
jgi:hypothetical protein